MSDYEFPANTVLRFGNKSEAVYQYQLMLAEAGFTEQPTEVFADGDFGKGTLEATRALQSAIGVTVDGVAGPATLSGLQKLLEPVNAIPTLSVGAAEAVNEPEPAGVREIMQNEVATTASGINADVLSEVPLQPVPPVETPVEPVPQPASAPKASKALTEEAIREAANNLGVDVACVKAVAEVESLGNGFNSTGMVKILFERHKFYKFIAQKYGVPKANQLAAMHPDICSPKAGGYTSSTATEHKRLDKAIAIDRECAMKSASWGRFQVMGFNYAAAGFANVEDFCVAMWKSEDEHLRAFVNFIKADANMHRHLKNRNWAAFANAYNGPAYAQNKYDTKLAAAYRKYS